MVFCLIYFAMIPCPCEGYYNPFEGSGLYYYCPYSTLPGAAVCGEGIMAAASKYNHALYAKCLKFPHETVIGQPKK